MTLPMHGLTRYLRVRVEVSDGVVRWRLPYTLLGLVPIGQRNVAVPIAEVRSVGVGRGVWPWRLLVGLGLIVAPWFLLPWWAAVPLLVVGLWVTVVALGPRLVLITRAGRRHRAAVCFGHKLDADLYIAAVEDLIARTN